MKPCKNGFHLLPYFFHVIVFIETNSSVWSICSSHLLNVFSLCMCAAMHVCGHVCGVQPRMCVCSHQPPTSTYVCMFSSAPHLHTQPYLSQLAAARHQAPHHSGVVEVSCPVQWRVAVAVGCAGAGACGQQPLHHGRGRARAGDCNTRRSLNTK